MDLNASENTHVVAVLPSTHRTRQPKPAPSSLRRPLLWYFGGLIVVYAAGMVVFWPSAGAQPSSALFFVIMFAPTLGALLAWAAGRGRIRWGRPNLWIFAGLIPTVLGLIGYLAASVAGLVTLDGSTLGIALAGSILAVASSCLSAIGEEIGWRGFLWPTLRQHSGFWKTTVVVLVVWWLYHVPLIALGWYGTMSGLAAFTVAIAGFVIFVGVITERSGSLWPSVVAHGAWNALVATGFAVTSGATKTAAFTGNAALLGEFGWIAAITTAILGTAAGLWHVRHPNPRAQVTGAITPPAA